MPTRNAHVVFLVNFVAPNLIAVCQEVAKRVGRFTILSSVAMESNRNWQSDWGDLDVVVQKTFTITRHPKHPGGYREVNYIHLPTDTLSQLRSLRPDAIVSLELGARTMLSSLYRSLNPRCAHVTSVYASERSEAGRGAIRRFARRRLLRRADWVTYNGPSCQRLLISLGADPQHMSPWNYASDPRKPYLGEMAAKNSRGNLRMLTVGQLSERKGMLPALQQLSEWCEAHPQTTIQWNVVGTGPLEGEMRSGKLPENLEVVFHGHCDPDAMRQHYCDNDVLLFPTLADEWGLVVDEAFFSGLPVIGSCHAQAVTTLVRDGVNGMIYDPQQADSLSHAMGRFMEMSEADYHRMPQAARETASSRTPQASAEQLVEAIGMAILRGKGLAAADHDALGSAEMAGSDVPVPRQTVSR